MGPRGPRGSGARVSIPLLLLLLPSLTTPATPDPTCPTPMSVAHADIQVKSYHPKSRERYTCHSGFKRKAGTSSLTQCVLNETTKTAKWTIPNLQCIRDPSLSHQRPPTTVVPTGAETPSPSGKEPASTSKSDSSSTRPAPSVGTDGWDRLRSFPTPSQTTATTLEQFTPTGTKSPSTFHRKVTVAVSVLLIILVAALMVLLVCLRRRQRPLVRHIEMEGMEGEPMAGGPRMKDKEPEELGPLRPGVAPEDPQALEQPPDSGAGDPGQPSR